jgi:hypothetical protein
MGYIGAGPTRFNTADDLTVTGDAEVTGAITTDGMTTTGNVSFGDNDKAIFGAGNDLQIYHDGSASYIDEAGTGSLYIRGNGTQVFITDSTSANHMARFTPSGASTLYYSGATKLATTSTGVDVTGRMSVDNGDTNAKQLRLNNTAASGTNTSGIEFSSLGFVKASIDAAVYGDGYMTFSTNNNSEKMRITAGGSVGIGTSSPSASLHISKSDDARLRLTDTGDACTFMVRSDGDNTSIGTDTAHPVRFMTYNTERLRIDSSGNVGIGTSSPSLGSNGSGLHIKGASGEYGVLKVDSSTTSEEGWVQFSNNGVDKFRIASDSSTNLKFIHSGVAERLRIDSSGNISINTTAATELLNVAASAGNSAGVEFAGNGTTVGSTSAFYGQGSGSDAYVWNRANNPILFGTNNAEKMRIDSSGDLLIGATSTANLGGINPKLIVQNISDGIAVQEINSGYVGLTTKASGAHNYYAAYFENSTPAKVGGIYCSTTSTSFQTSSDYRLKENVVADWDATTRLKQLNPVRFNFIADADTTVDGFLAHEVQDVVPEAISGTKDAMRDEEYEVSAATGDIYTPAAEATFDEDGNEVTAATDEVIHSTDVEQPETLAEGQQWRETTAAVMGTRSVPDYQGIDQSKLVPLLVKTIQELEARIVALETA